jgi:hypothetical protein
MTIHINSISLSCFASVSCPQCIEYWLKLFESFLVIFQTRQQLLDQIYGDSNLYWMVKTIR